MMQSRSLLLETSTRDEASERAARLGCAAVGEGIARRGVARLLLSGGSTPEDVYRRMSETRIDWRKVTVGLIDERNVDPSHEASNHALVARTLLTAHAKLANFIPMWSDSPDLKEKAMAASQAYRSLTPTDFALFGMGNDGHTASWFPETDDLKMVLSSDAPLVAGVNAATAAGSAERLTMTLPAIAKIDKAVLLIFGQQKLDVFKEATQSHGSSLPVRALADALGNRLTVIWAP